MPDEEANQQEGKTVARALMEAQKGGAGSEDGIVAASANPYISPVTRALAESMRREQAEANKPQYFTAGNDRVVYDPRTQQSNVLYDGHSDAEDYALTLGFEPGTDPFNVAMQDYVLRANGPTAYGYDVDLENTRQGNRESLEVSGSGTGSRSVKLRPMATLIHVPATAVALSRGRWQASLLRSSRRSRGVRP